MSAVVDRTRSMARRRAIVRAHEAALPRSGSKRPGRAPYLDENFLAYFLGVGWIPDDG
jgi:hypothetical protein